MKVSISARSVRAMGAHVSPAVSAASTKVGRTSRIALSRGRVEGVPDGQLQLDFKHGDDWRSRDVEDIFGPQEGQEDVS